MATSGTYDQVEFSVASLLDQATLRAGKPTSQITAEDIQTALREFNLLFKGQYSNRGLKLWAIEQSLYGLYVGQRAYPIELNTIELKNVNLRTTQRLTGSGTAATSAGGTVEYAFDGDTGTILTQVAPLGNISYDFGTDTLVTYLGILPGATATVEYVLEASDDDLNWDTYFTVGSRDYVDGDWVWLDLTISQPRRYWRLRAAAGTVVLRELVFGDLSNDIPLYGLNRDDYASLPNKSFWGRPTQYWWDRTIPQPQIVLWPVPSDTFLSLNVFRYRQLQDVTSITQTLEVPTRWWSVVVEALTEKLIRCGVGDYGRLPDVQAALKEALFLAENAEQDPGPVFVMPNFSGYTR